MGQELTKFALDTQTFRAEVWTVPGVWEKMRKNYLTSTSYINIEFAHTHIDTDLQYECTTQIPGKH